MGEGAESVFAFNHGLNPVVKRCPAGKREVGGMTQAQLRQDHCAPSAVFSSAQGKDVRSASTACVILLAIENKENCADSIC